MPNNRLNIIASKKYGFLLAIKEIGPDKFGCIQWLCKCDCGNEIIVTSYKLYHKLTVHCNCRSGRLKYTDRSMPARNKIYKNYKSYAASKNIKFFINKKDFFRLTDSNCFYCGSPPSTIVTINNRHNPSTFIYNGIDRIDSTKGYIPGNIVPCCKKCNFAKSNRSQEEFISWAIKLGSCIASTDNTMISDIYLEISSKQI